MNAPKQNKEALGKGIRSLLQSIDSDLKTGSGQLKSTVVETATGSFRIPVDDIDINPKQPRRYFDEEALNELASSIKTHDIIQPVTVSRMPSGRYRLVSGERRLRASKLAGLKDIPAYIRQTNDQEELDLTQEQVAERMGKDRSTIANFIRLLKLPPDIQVAVRIGEISMGHARALINVDSIDKQLFVFDQIKEKGLSVRQTEALVRNLYKDSGVVKKHTKSSLPDGFQRIEDKLASHFSTRVKMKHSKDNSGSITFEYYSMDELNKILGQLDVPLD